jgi:hypothetical protein
MCVVHRIELTVKFEAGATGEDGVWCTFTDNLSFPLGVRTTTDIMRR